ncbi:hypothetical protein [Hylemonella gracilis]|uniref:hypothetical protein n=1 Tax=Hylemonella gracilis TaxID=80880 RepID=UPI001F6193CE|nr:hypothetical protein [Hylemonella gracilis]
MATTFFTGTLAVGLLETADVLARAVVFGTVLAGVAVFAFVFAAVLPGTDLAATGFWVPGLAGALEAATALDLAGALTDLAGLDAVFLTAGLADGLTAAFVDVVVLPVAFFAPAAPRVWDAAAPALPRAGAVGGLALEGDDAVIDLAGLAFT